MYGKLSRGDGADLETFVFVAETDIDLRGIQDKLNVTKLKTANVEYVGGVVRRSPVMFRTKDWTLFLPFCRSKYEFVCDNTLYGFEADTVGLDGDNVTLKISGTIHPKE